MQVYIQVNTEITMWRLEQIIQTTRGCGGDLGKINKNMIKKKCEEYKNL